MEHSLLNCLINKISFRKYVLYSNRKLYSYLSWHISAFFVKMKIGRDIRFKPDIPNPISAEKFFGKNLTNPFDKAYFYEYLPQNRLGISFFGTEIWFFENGIFPLKIEFFAKIGEKCHFQKIISPFRKKIFLRGFVVNTHKNMLYQMGLLNIFRKIFPRI